MTQGGEAAIRQLTGKVAIVHWKGYAFTVSQVRWGLLRRGLYRLIYRKSCPEHEIKFETAVFLSNADGRFNPQKPLHLCYQKDLSEAKATMKTLCRQLAEGQMAFQSLFQQ